MAVRDGDGWVQCRCGRRHWGRFGAAGLVLARSGPLGPQVLLQHRADWVHDGGTWAVPGGARDSHEDVVQAALREAHEEVGLSPAHLTVRLSVTGTDHVDWAYDYVLAEAGPAAAVRAANAETAALHWAGLDAVPDLPLHRALAQDWGWLARQVVDLFAATPRTVVDGD